MYVSNSLHIASEGVAEFQARSQKKVCFPLFVTHHQAGGTTRQISLSLSLSTYIYIYIYLLSRSISRSLALALSLAGRVRSRRSNFKIKYGQQEEGARQGLGGRESEGERGGGGWGSSSGKEESLDEIMNGLASSGPRTSLWD
jgi:hypothetical protein